MSLLKAKAACSCSLSNIQNPTYLVITACTGSRHNNGKYAIPLPAQENYYKVFCKNVS